MTTAVDPMAISREDILVMNEDELQETINIWRLDVNPDDFQDNLAGLRDAVASALGLEERPRGTSDIWGDVARRGLQVLAGIAALVAVAQLLPVLVPPFGPSVDDQLTELRATTKALTVTTGRLDEIVILGERTGETTVDEGGQTVQVRRPSLVARMERAQSDLVLVRNTANEANRQSHANSDAVSALQTANVAQDEQIHRAASSRAALAKKTEAVEAQVAGLGNHFNALGSAVEEVRATASAARIVAHRAKDDADTLAILIAGLDQRTATLEAINTFLYTGNDSLLTLAVGNGSVAPELVAGLEAGQRAVDKYRPKK